MKKCGLLGEKLGHSLSPEIHKHIWAELGLQGQYDLLEVPASRLPALVSALGRDYSGVNVTVPHKVAVLPEVTWLSPEAERIGAVNTLLFKGQEVKGFNTDYFGFGRMLERNGLTVKGKKLAVLGTGGAAKAVVQYLLDNGAGEILLVSRKKDGVKTALHVISYEELSRRKGDIIINCTPVGMFPKIDASPVAPKVLRNFAAAVDLIYNPAETQFLRFAREAGIPAVNGLYMLVAQAVASEEIWLGREIRPEVIDKVLQKMKK